MDSWKTRVEAATVKTLSDELGSGQGVLVSGGFVVTAAHCIDCWSTDGGMMLGDYRIARIQPNSFDELRTSPVAVEPCTDIAVLTECDGQELSGWCEAFNRFCESTPPVELATYPIKAFEAFDVWILSHTGEWISAEAELFNPNGATLGLQARSQVVGGTSGGPIVDTAGRLLGVVSNASITPATGHWREGFTCSGHFPWLCRCLPPWILDQIRSET